MKKIYTSFQNIQVLVGLWGSNEAVEKAKERLESAEKGSLQIVINFREGLSQVEQSQFSKIP